MRYAKIGPDELGAAVEAELEAGCASVTLAGVEGREDEKRLVKLLERRRGTKVLGLLLGLDCSAWEDEPIRAPARSLELGLMPKDRRRVLSMMTRHWSRTDGRGPCMRWSYIKVLMVSPAQSKALFDSGRQEKQTITRRV